MKTFLKKIVGNSHIHDSVTLPYAARIKSRLRVILDSGEEAGIHLPRGSSLHHGDVLISDDGFTIQVNASHEKVSTVLNEDPHLVTRACYHLGNRHVPLQIDKNFLRYLHDHVLDNMLISLGLKVNVEFNTFEPESGAYHHSHSKNHEQR